MKLKIWTEAYRPFIMGGDVHAPISTEVEVGEPVRLGKGVLTYVVTSPRTGKTHVAEASSGALVGTSLDRVQADVDAATPAVMKRQIAEALERRKKCDFVPAEDFWRLLDHSRE